MCACVCETDLQQVGADAFVGALLGDLLGETRDLVGGLGDVLGALDERTLVAAAAAHQPGHLRHEQRHALGRRDDVITLHTGHARGQSLKGQR